MPELTEPAPYADGPEVVERAVARRPFFVLPLYLRQHIGVFLLYLAFTHILLGLSLGWYEAVWCVYLVLALLCHLRYRVVADSEGIRQVLPWGTRRVKWDEVTSYFLTWPMPGTPPNPRGEYGSGFLMSAGPSRFFRIPQPAELAVLIVTGKGRPIRLAPDLVGREAFCRVVRQRAFKTPTKKWMTVEYVVPKDGRQFAYQGPFANKAVLVGLLTTAAFIYFSILLLSSSSSFSTFSRIWKYGFILESMVLVTLSVSSTLKEFGNFLWRRELARRKGEKVLVSGNGIAWEKGDKRIEIEWSEITDLKQVGISPFFGGRRPWRVTSQQDEISFIPAGLVLGGGLPALINARSPQLWTKTAPIAEPGSSS